MRTTTTVLVKSGRELVLVVFVEDEVELVLYREEARQLGETLVRASFEGGGESSCPDGSAPLEVAVLRAIDASASGGFLHDSNEQRSRLAGERRRPR